MLLNHESVKQVQERPTVLLGIDKGVSNNNVIEDTDRSVASVVCEVEKEPVDDKNSQASMKLLDMNGVEP
jgi:hypothetical protein